MTEHERSYPWETEEGWEKVVAQPILSHVMAPRHAAEILAVAGQLMDRGVSKDEIVRRIRGWSE